MKQRDPAYVQWLVQQAWFRERFSPIYQIVVNNFAPPSEETPAHNALQAQFLNFDFRVAFMNASGFDWGWHELRDRYRSAVKRHFKAPAADWGRRHYGRAASESHRQAVRKMWSVWRARHDAPKSMRLFGKPQFECVSDVSFDITAQIYFTDAESDPSVEKVSKVFIEIKPSMGDDYPAVLRQVKRQKHAAGGYGYAWFLLVDQFASQAVTLEQAREIFKSDGIDIVMMSDVRDALITHQGQE